jgi:HTH-type transcriptional regulator / antitoxin HigA
MSYFNSAKYGSLLSETLPMVIETDEDCDRMEKVLDRLLSKGDNLSPEEDKLLDLVSDLIEAYEDKVYPIEAGKPDEILRHLISENNYRQKDLLHIFGSSGIASEVINGKRSISKAHAKKLAEFFNVSVELFI